MQLTVVCIKMPSLTCELHSRGRSYKTEEKKFLGMNSIQPIVGPDDRAIL